MSRDESLRDRCRENLERVTAQIDATCRRAGRPVDSVTLVAVTKYAGADVARILLESGCRDLAESRPQALWAKAEALADAVPAPRWHLVGHLQRNKVRRTLPLVSLLHSLDGQRLLDTLEAEGAAAGRVCRALVEVNLSGDPTRTGVDETEAARLVAAAAGLAHVKIVGLMGMASVPDGRPGAARVEFARLRELRDRLAGSAADRDGLPELSMGMSGDFEEAILEGATLVRVGSALFEGLDAPAGGG